MSSIDVETYKSEFGHTRLSQALFWAFSKEIPLGWLESKLLDCSKIGSEIAMENGFKVDDTFFGKP